MCFGILEIIFPSSIKKCNKLKQVEAKPLPENGFNL
jgi:hypothetical protein